MVKLVSISNNLKVQNINHKNIITNAQKWHMSAKL